MVRKRILVVNIGTEIGGIEKCLLNFLKYLNTRNCEVDLLFWKPSGPLFPYIPKNMKVLENPGPGPIRKIIKMTPFQVKIQHLLLYFWYKIWQRRGMEWKALPMLKDNYDVAISYCQNGISPYYVIDKVNAKEKYMFYHHGSYDKSEPERQVDAKYYSEFNRIITVSNTNKQMLEGYFPLLSDRIIAIHNLIDENSILAMSNEEKKCFSKSIALKLITVGRLSSEKGQLFALSVAKELMKRNVSFEWIFVGDGPLKQECIEYCKENKLEDFCRFIGAKRNPYPFVMQADVYVQTSTIEADPTTIHEAKVLRKPIVASNIPAINEATVGYCNYKVCDFDSVAFADAILDIANQGENRNDRFVSVNSDSVQKLDCLLNFNRRIL